MSARRPHWAAWPLIVLVHAYRYLISPVLHMIAPGSGCRFTPTCSEYALESLRRHGALRGSLLALRRLMRCHPWGGHGYDPVPERDHKKAGGGGPAHHCQHPHHRPLNHGISHHG